MLPQKRDIHGGAYSPERSEENSHSGSGTPLFGGYNAEKRRKIFNEESRN